MADSRPRAGRKAEILELFIDRVARQGYDVTSLGELAGELELSKGTIVHHFGSKDRMFLEMALSYMERRVRELEIIVESGVDPDHQLRLVIASLLLVHRDDRAATIAVSREFVRFAAEPLMTDVRALRARYLQIVSSIIDRGVAEGLFRPTDSRIQALQVIGMCNWAWTWLRPDGRKSVEAIARTFIQTFMTGIRTQLATNQEVLPELPSEVVAMRREHERLHKQLLGSEQLPPILPAGLNPRTQGGRNPIFRPKERRAGHPGRTGGPSLAR